MRQSTALSIFRPFTSLLSRAFRGLREERVQQIPDALRGPRASSGQSVTESTAMTFTAFAAAVRIIAETIASLPLKVIRESADGKTKMPAKDLAIYWALHSSPNPETTAFRFFETLMGHILVWGNGYAEIERTRGGAPKALWTLLPTHVTPKQSDTTGELLYEVRDDVGQTRTLMARNVLHVPALGFDGIMGYSPIVLHKQSLGLSMALEEHSGRIFGNGAWPCGIFKSDKPIPKDKEQIENLRRSLEGVHGGAERSGKLAILWQGMSWDSIGLPNDVMQLIQSRTFGIQDVARAFRLPPHMLAEESRATFSNIGDQAKAFVIYTLTAWIVRLEQELNLKLFGRGQQDVYAKFSVAGLLRGDIKTRFEAYKTAKIHGWMTANEIRELEDLNPGPKALDEYDQPLNIGSTGRSEEQDGDKDGATSDDDSDSDSNDGAPDRRAFEPIFADVAHRLLRKEHNAVQRALKRFAKDVKGFQEWVTTFYVQHEKVAREAYGPAVASFKVSTGSLLNIDDVARRHIGVSRGQLLGIKGLSGDAYVKAVNDRLLTWDKSRADKIAREEVSRDA